MDKNIKTMTTPLFVSEKFAKEIYGFEDVSGNDFIYHWYHQCVIKEVDNKYGIPYIHVEDNRNPFNDKLNNIIRLAAKRDLELQANPFIWINNWDILYTFENVSTVQFIKLCKKLGAEEIPKEIRKTDCIEDFLNG